MFEVNSLEGRGETDSVGMSSDEEEEESPRMRRIGKKAPPPQPQPQPQQQQQPPHDSTVVVGEEEEGYYEEEGDYYEEGEEESIYYEEGLYYEEEEEEGFYYEEEEEQSNLPILHHQSTVSAPARPRSTVVTTRPKKVAPKAFVLPSMDRSQQNLLAIPDDIISRQGLQKLNLSKNKIGSAVDLNKLVELTKLDLSHNSTLDSLEVTWSRLEELRISGCSISKLTFVGDMSKLRIVSADGCFGLGVVPLFSLPALEELSLNHCGISELPTQVKAPLLKLFLRGNAGLTRMPAFSLLRYLEAVDCSALEILDSLPQILHLNVSGTKAALATAWERYSTLELLDISKNHCVKLVALPAGLKTLAAQTNFLPALPPLPSTLEVLNVNDNQVVTLPALPSRLVTLHCAFNRLDTLPELPATLETLNIAHNVLDLHGFKIPPRLRVLLCGYNFKKGGGGGGETSSVPLLDLSPCKELKELMCSHVAISGVPLTLRKLLCSHLNLRGCGPYILDELSKSALTHLSLAHVDIAMLPVLPASLIACDLSDCKQKPRFAELTTLRGSGAGLREPKERFIVHPSNTEAWLANVGRTASSPWDIGVADMQGRRPTMEDAWFLHRSDAWDLVILCDGHASAAAARFVATALPAVLLPMLGANPKLPLTERQWKQALSQVEGKLRTFVATLSGPARHCGTTMVALLCHHPSRTITTVNIGDSRALFVHAPKFLRGVRHVTRLSVDHKPDVESERQRIIAAGGFVEGHRVNGTLGVSRSMGDFFLHPIVISDPHFRTFPYPEDGAEHADLNWLVLGCDGVFDELWDERVALLLQDDERGLSTPRLKAERLRDAAYILNSDDNISVILLQYVKRTK